ncbi:MAG: IgGFc-binding protein [Kofleriaceae bacterium]
MRWLLVTLVAVAMGCGPGNRNGGSDDDDDVDASMPDCNEGVHRCNLTTYEVCANGQWATVEECTGVCSETIGCAECSPGTPVCRDGNVHSCDANGMIGGQTTACTGSEICDNGACVDACMTAATNRSYVGCEYWAVDLDNAVEVIATQGSFDCALTMGAKNVTMNVCSNPMAGTVAGECDPPNGTCPNGFTCQSTAVCILDAQKSPFAIVVSNPQARSVDVTVTGPNGETFVRTVAAGQVQALLPQMSSVPDQSIDGTGKAKKAYKVTSTLPIVAYQFNPLDNVNVFSNDASLLIPAAAFDTQYYVMSYPTLDRRPQTHPFYGYVSIVASQDNTMIEVTPSAAVVAGAGQPALAANAPASFTLNRHDVLTLQAAVGGDLTGTKIRAVNSNVPFGVFGGHEALGVGEENPPDMVHTDGPCCADHVEEMLFPTSTWGKTFAITRSQPRGTNEPDFLRIMAQKPNTTLQFIPAPLAGSCGMLDAGQFCEVKIAVDTSIAASEPVLVGHYLQSAIWQDILFGEILGEGDPDLSIAVPTEQYRTEYTVLVPNSYAKNFLSISAPPQGAVLVDGAAVTMTPFANGSYRANRTMVAAGQHKIQCPAGCGVEVYGYGPAVSYMFAGGLDLKQIVIQ